MRPTIDVVIPCYRYGRYLEQCVESVLNQHDVQPRILIIDDFSPDDSAKVASDISRRHANVQSHLHSSNKGHIATYNEGIEWASSEFFLLLSADDYLLPGSLGRAARLLSEHPEAGFAFGCAMVLGDDGTIEPLNPMSNASPGETRILARHAFIELSGATNIVPTPTAVVRTELQKRAGGYREDLPHSGDMEMWMRLSTHAPVGFINDDQAVYRRHSSNMSLIYTGHNILRDFSQRRKAIEMVFEAKPPIPNATAIESGLFRDLASKAIGQASAVFKQGNADLSRELRRFALEVSPNAWKSRQWAKLSLIRLVGLPNWRAINAVRGYLAPFWSRLQQFLRLSPE